MSQPGNFFGPVEGWATEEVLRLIHNVDKDLWEEIKTKIKTQEFDGALILFFGQFSLQLSSIMFKMLFAAAV